MISTQTDRLLGTESSVAVKAPCKAYVSSTITQSGEGTFGGVALVDGGRYLYNLTPANVLNGIWVVRESAHERAKDFDGARDVVQGTMVIVATATSNATMYRLTTVAPIVIGTSAIAFVAAGVDDLAGLTFTAAGTGAVSRAALDKMREARSATDYSGADSTGVADSLSAFNSAAAAVGANGLVFVPPGTWNLSAIPGTRCTWVVDPLATFTGAGSLSTPASLTSGRIVQLGGGGLYGKATKIGAQSSWLEAVRASTENNADLVVLSAIGQGGIIGGSRTSDFITAGSMGCIGLAGWALNDNTNPAQVQSAYAGYFEARRYVSGGDNAGSTQGIEIDIVNFGSLVSQTPLAPNNVGISEGLRIASGGGEAGATTASSAISIISNTKKFERGIIFQDTALVTTSGEAEAIAFGRNQAISWYSASGPVVRMRSDATAASFGVIFGNGSLNLQTYAGAGVFTFTTAGAITGLIAGFGNYANDAAAAAGGVVVGQFYRNGSILMVRAV